MTPVFANGALNPDFVGNISLQMLQIGHLCLYSFTVHLGIILILVLVILLKSV
jgi:hypothetical protein